MRSHLLFVSVFLVSSVSFAQTGDVVPSEPTAERQDSSAAEALRTGHLGLEAFQAGLFEEALAAFTKAESLTHSPVFVLYQGRAAEGLGRLLEARDYFCIAAAEPLTERSPPAWQSSVGQAYSLKVAIEARIPQVLLRIQGEVRFPVVVTIDDGQQKTIESNSLHFEALPGEYVIKARDATGQ